MAVTRILTMSFTLAVVITVAAAAPVPKDAGPLPYYPTGVGASWTYDSNNVKPRRAELVVRTVEKKDNGIIVSVEFEDGGKWCPVEKVLVSTRGLFLMERGGSAFDPPVCILKLPHKPGEEWETVTTFVEREFRFKHKALDPESVRIPAGQFKALPVVQELRMTGSGAELWPQTYWYAPGVGRIKSTTDGGLLEELESFTASK
jgi:hypothetical protein